MQTLMYSGHVDTKHFFVNGGEIRSQKTQVIVLTRFKTMLLLN